MATCRRAIAFSVLSFAGSSTIAGQSAAQDVRCQRGDLVRQIEVQFTQDGDGLPCRVIWRSSPGSDQRELVWRSDSQLDFCTEKARQLVHRLLDGGWACDMQTAASADRSSTRAFPS